MKDELRPLKMTDIPCPRCGGETGYDEASNYDYLICGEELCTWNSTYSK